MKELLKLKAAFMRNNKKSFDEISCDILVLTVVIGFITFGIGCVTDAIFVWIAIFTGKMMISINTCMLLMGIPVAGTLIILLLLLLISVIKFGIKKRG